MAKLIIKLNTDIAYKSDKEILNAAKKYFAINKEHTFMHKSVDYGGLIELVYTFNRPIDLEDINGIGWKIIPTHEGDMDLYIDEEYSGYVSNLYIVP